MKKIYIKSLLLTVASFLCIGLAAGLAFGYSITIDSKDDAGQYFGETAYLRIVQDQNTSHDILSSDTKWLSKVDVENYVISQNIPYWNHIESAGNIWSTDTYVGDSLAVLPGTYRVTPIGGAFNAFTFDSFGWSDWTTWWWEMQIRVIEADNTYTDYILGAPPNPENPYGGYSSPEDAFNAVRRSYLDLNVAEGGSLNFWIWDINSIDNSGGLSVNITPIPESSMIVLLSIGLIALPGMRKLRA